MESDDEKPSTSTQIKIKQEVDKDMDTSDSSDDEVLCKKESTQPETKRKAEVLSKESGKIGITIKTSPPSSVNTIVAATKEEKLKKGPPEPMETSTLEVKPADSSVFDVKKVKTTEPKEEVPADNVSSSVASNKEVASSSPTPTNRVPRDESKLTSQTTMTRKEEVTVPQVNNNQPKQQTQEQVQQPSAIPEPPTTPKSTTAPAEQTSPYHEFASPRLWLPKFHLTDQIFITDVTVNSETATIRECKTEKGFFKERAAITNQVESIPVTQPWIGLGMKS